MKRILIVLFSIISGISPGNSQSFYKNIKVGQAEKLIRLHDGIGDLVILDVRTPGEFEKGHIKGAVNFDYWNKEFQDSISRLDRKKIYLVYCASGVRSGNAMKLMRTLGFERLYNMRGGTFAWKAAKFPLVI